MSYLSPLLPDVRAIEYRGKYRVQLDVPSWSTLSETDIEHVLRVSSWDNHDIKCIYPGGRGIHIKREAPVVRKYPLRGLQINGVGYAPLEFGDGVMLVNPNVPFLPPSRANFMEMAPKNTMRTSYLEGTTLKGRRPAYRPLGTYSAEELAITVQNTQIAAGLPLRLLVVPQVEAYGRFLDEELSRPEGNFGFVVLSIPSAEQDRLSTELQRSSVNGFDYVNKASWRIQQLTRGLRDLHDNGFIHWQAHLSNVYAAIPPYMMDWTTMTPISAQPEVAALERALDVTHCAQNVANVLVFAGTNAKHREPIMRSFWEGILEVYIGKPQPLSNEELFDRAARRYGKKALEHHFHAEFILAALEQEAERNIS
jgi:hypothetical protein